MNEVIPSPSRQRESAPQGAPMGQRERDERASEGRPGMGRIEGDILSRDRHPLTRKRADFPRVVRHERTWPTNSRGNADMSAAATLAGAAPDRVIDWSAINWRKVYRTV